MAHNYAKSFYTGKAWRQTRTAFLQSKHYICQRCGGVASIAHHIKHITPQNICIPEIALSWDNLLACCHDCHNAIHGYDVVCREDVMFNEEGQLVKRPYIVNNSNLIHGPVKPYQPGVSKVFK